MSIVTKHLEGLGLDFEAIPHAKAYTSVDEARALGIAADEVLKTVAIRTGEGYAIAVLTGARRLDMSLVREAVGDRRARLATEVELERDFPEFELGALPPLGSLLGAKTLLDPEVLEHDVVVFAAGSQVESVRMRRADLFGDEPVTTVPLTRHPEDEDKERIG